MIYPGLAAIALPVRRLHDTDRSDWWYLVGVIPYVGLIILVVRAPPDPTATMPPPW
jgi:uncharacterized membrane protein YhaH (DUF805 family)